MYNSVIMTATDWAQFILTMLSIGTIIVGSIRWYIKVQVKPIAEAVEDIRKEIQHFWKNSELQKTFEMLNRDSK